jgi:hypothetical protein
MSAAFERFVVAFASRRSKVRSSISASTSARWTPITPARRAPGGAESFVAGSLTVSLTAVTDD